MVSESNIIWKDSNGVIRKWIDQRTGDVMEYEYREALTPITNKALGDLRLVENCGKL